MRALRCIKKTRKSDKMSHECGLMFDDDDFDVGGCGSDGDDKRQYHLKTPQL